MQFVTKSVSLFRGTKVLENQIDEFLDGISEAGIVFRKAISLYLDNGVNEEFLSYAGQLNKIEGRGDRLRRKIEIRLYEQNLIPDLRADVLSLVENLDDLLNTYDANGFRFTIEKPDFRPLEKMEMMNLVDAVTNCVENAILASRAFFRDFFAVRDHNHKVMFYEHEADKIGSELKKKVFDSDLPLASKMHIRYFIDLIDQIADDAEDIADQLAINVIKRDM
ncbi:MAG: DUF47 domain-containing protein [Alphaproteobacteria bacterium]